MKVSVLVPVYNAQCYLPKCLDSILGQTFKDFELILVDDGSTDGSGEICDSYAQIDSRIRVFHQSNRGISRTREFALSQARGDYFQFVDADDWVEPVMMERMYQKAVDTEADIVGCGFWEHLPDKTIEHTTIYGDKQLFLRDVISNHWGVLWKLLIRKDVVLMNQIHFPANIDAGEDYYFVTSCLLKAQRVVCENGSFYHYNRCNSSSTISNPSISKIMEQVEATKLVEELLKKNHELLSFRSALRMRKFIAKEGLKAVSFWRWFFIFPEANIIWIRVQLGKWRKILVK